MLLCKILQTGSQMCYFSLCKYIPERVLTTQPGLRKIVNILVRGEFPG